MSVYSLGSHSLNVLPFYEERFGEDQVQNIVATLSKLPLPTDDVGMICLDHAILEQGLLIFVALYNTTDARVTEESAEIHLYNGEGDKVASGLLSEGGLPEMEPGDVHVWHFLMPKTAFLVSDVKLGLYQLEVISKTEGTLDRTYTFNHIMAKSKEKPDDLRARITLMNTPIEYLTEISLEELTNKKKKDE